MQLNFVLMTKISFFQVLFAGIKVNKNLFLDIKPSNLIPESELIFLVSERLFFTIWT